MSFPKSDGSQDSDIMKKARLIRKSIYKNYEVTFQIKSSVPPDLLRDGIIKQLGTPVVPNGFHIVARELATLQIWEIKPEEVKSDVAPGPE
jgi:hypothetical protein